MPNPARTVRQVAEPAIDPRLMELVGAALCWAEWPDPAKQEGDPLKYWRKMPPEVQRRYAADAERFVRAMMGSRGGYAVVPAIPTADMRDAAFAAGAGLRSDEGLARLWAAMLEVRPKIDDPVFEQATDSGCSGTQAVTGDA